MKHKSLDTATKSRQESIDKVESELKDFESEDNEGTNIGLRDK